jgi:phage terminase large subunit-like protein
LTTTLLRARTKALTRGERVCEFISRYCRVPEGKHVGKPLRLMQFQRRFILDIYDNPAGTSRAYLSIARKNGKTAAIAAIVLAHLVGPEARLNSQIISGARSRDQAALVFKLAEKMVRLNPDLAKIVKVIPSSKMLIGLTMNVEYKAISAEAGTAHGLSPVVAILDEVGQVRGPYDAFVEAIITAQGAHDNPLLLAISTQAATDADLFSIWLDDAQKSEDPRIVCHLYTAPEGCELDDREAWKAANPAMGEFRSVQDLEDFAATAQRQPTAENSFRWLYLNQRVEASSPFVSKAVWMANGAAVDDLQGVPVYGGLDLSEVNDLTALVLIGQRGNVWHVKPTFWLPGDSLADKARADRVQYDIWRDNGHLVAAPGKSIDYEYVAEWLREVFDRYDVQKIAFDRWNWRHFRPWLLKAGFTEAQLEAHFVEFGQGFQSMSPALRDLESALLNERLAHGGHPVLAMCAANAVVQSDPAGNRKLSKARSSGRIDGMVALAMALGVVPAETVEEVLEPGILFI